MLKKLQIFLIPKKRIIVFQKIVFDPYNYKKNKKKLRAAVKKLLFMDMSINPFRD